MTESPSPSAARHGGPRILQLWPSEAGAALIAGGVTVSACRSSGSVEGQSSEPQAHTFTRPHEPSSLTRLPRDARRRRSPARGSPDEGRPHARLAAQSAYRPAGLTPPTRQRAFDRGLFARGPEQSTAATGGRVASDRESRDGRATRRPEAAEADGVRRERGSSSVIAGRDPSYPVGSTQLSKDRRPSSFTCRCTSVRAVACANDLTGLSEGPARRRWPASRHGGARVTARFAPLASLVVEPCGTSTRAAHALGTQEFASRRTTSASRISRTRRAATTGVPFETLCTSDRR